MSGEEGDGPWDTERMGQRRLQGVGGPGSAPSMSRCVTSGLGVVGTGLFGGTLDLVVSKVSPGHNDVLISVMVLGGLEGTVPGVTPQGLRRTGQWGTVGHSPGAHVLSPWMHGVLLGTTWCGGPGSSSCGGQG